MKKFSFLLYLTFHTVLLAQEQYPNNNFEIISLKNGNTLPFIIYPSNGTTYGFESIEIENPFLQGGLTAVGDSHTYREINGLDQTVLQESTITETLINEGIEKMVKKEIYNHFTSQRSVEYLPYTEQLTQMNSGIFNTEQFSPDNFSGTINLRGAEQINELNSQEYLTAGSNWTIGFEASGLMDLSEDGITATVPADLKIDMDLSYLGCAEIETEWGYRNAALITASLDGSISMGEFNVDMSNFVDFPSGQDPNVKFLGFSMDISLFMNAYLLKDLGEYMINMKGTFSLPSQFTFEYQGQYNSVPIPQSFPSIYSQRSYTGRSYSDSPQNFTEKSEFSSPHSGMLQSWTWNGAFPWVYDHSSQSWYYYYFNNGGYFVYHSNLNNWFKFNISSGEWSPTSF